MIDIVPEIKIDEDNIIGSVKIYFDGLSYDEQQKLAQDAATSRGGCSNIITKNTGLTHLDIALNEYDKELQEFFKARIQITMEM